MGAVNPREERIEKEFQEQVAVMHEQAQRGVEVADVDDHKEVLVWV